VQVDPIKSMLKPPGSQRLKLNCDILSSTSAFKFDLCRYHLFPAICFVHYPAIAKIVAEEAGAYTRPLFGST
jgi:hypothetical protein